MTNKSTHKFGLVGRNISYSFSKEYFTKKFISEKSTYTYENIDIQKIEDLLDYLANNIEFLKGFNITIPFKEVILKYLDEIDQNAQEIGAVNCVKVIDNQYLKGFNTDTFGFENSIKPLLKKHHKKAIILGTGGASKAVAYTLKKLQIDVTFVSRQPTKDQITYKELTKTIIRNHQIIINTTPLGTAGKNEEYFPNIPYQYINNKHLLYDLIYNPKETIFLKKGKQNNAVTKNGLEMLKLQADKSWEIWNY